MPPVTTLQSAYVRVRLQLYLKPFLNCNGLTISALGHALDVPSSRASSWINGRRIATSETAFRIGEVLRERGFRTSGMEALYACGYWYDLLRLFNQLTLTSEGSGTLAVFAYCALPFIHKRLDNESLFTTLLSATTDEHRYKDLVRVSSRTLFELRLAPRLRNVDWQTDYECFDMSCKAVAAIRRADAIPVISDAWNNVLLSRSRAAVSRNITPIFIPNPDAIETMRVIIQLSRTLRNSIPTISGARLWRLASEWAGDTDPDTLGYFQVAVPPLFSPNFKVGTYSEMQLIEWLSLDFTPKTVEQELLNATGGDLKRRLLNWIFECNSYSDILDDYSDKYMCELERYNSMTHEEELFWDALSPSTEDIFSLPEDGLCYPPLAAVGAP